MKLIQFYSNNATHLHHLTRHSTTMLPHKMAIVLRPQICDVTSPYVALLDVGPDCPKRRINFLGERTCPRMLDDNLS